MHVRYKSLYIFLPSSAKQQREMTKFCVVYGTWRRRLIIRLLSLTIRLLEAFLKPIHRTPEEFEKGGFTLKTYQMFSVHTTLEEYDNAKITDQFVLCLVQTRAGKCPDYLRSQKEKCFPSTIKRKSVKPVLSLKFLRLKSVFGLNCVFVTEY